MWSSLTEYHHPTTIERALRLLARPALRTAPLAGGTWLVAQRDPAIEAVVDLGGLRLAFVRPRRRDLRLGAMTTLQSLISDPTARALADGLLSEAARRFAPRPIRNAATLGGTLVAGDAACEVLLALLALDAQVVIRAPERRVVSLDAFLADRAVYLPPAGLIVEVRVPLPAAGAVGRPARACGAALAEVSRTPRDRPIVNAAALVARKGGVCVEARLALGGVAPTPVRLPPVETALAGHALDDDALTRVAREVATAVSPPADFRASAEYRREMTGVVAARALREAWKDTGVQL